MVLLSLFEQAQASLQNLYIISAPAACCACRHWSHDYWQTTEVTTSANSLYRTLRSSEIYMTFLTTDNATSKVHSLSVKVHFIFGLLPCFCKKEHLQGTNFEYSMEVVKFSLVAKIY
jgi:hypothetical protein